MWQLKNERGTVVKSQQLSAWECCKGAFKKNGSPYRRKNVMHADSSFVVYMKEKKTEFIKLPIVDDNGNVTEEVTRVVNNWVMVPYLVEKV